jgi:hypothetical protein
MKTMIEFLNGEIEKKNQFPNNLILKDEIENRKKTK